MSPESESNASLAQFQQLADMIVRVMSKEYHEVEVMRKQQPVPPEEQHGLDEFVVAYGSKVLTL
jgi:hypothetical protein